MLSFVPLAIESCQNTLKTWKTAINFVPSELWYLQKQVELISKPFAHLVAFIYYHIWVYLITGTIFITYFYDRNENIDCFLQSTAVPQKMKIQNFDGKRYKNSTFVYLNPNLELFCIWLALVGKVSQEKSLEKGKFVWKYLILKKWRKILKKIPAL